jgi:hypothetical protein
VRSSQTNIVADDLICAELRIRRRELQNHSIGATEAHRDAGLPLPRLIAPLKGTVVPEAYRLCRRLRQGLIPAEHVNLLHQTIRRNHDLQVHFTADAFIRRYGIDNVRGWSFSYLQT